MKRPQNAKAAAQRLAQAMSHQPSDDNNEEDDLLYDFEPAVPSAGIGLGLAGARPAKNRTPVSVRKPVEPLPLRPTSGARASPVEPHHAASSLRPSQPKPVETPPSLHSSVASHSSQLPDSAEEVPPPIRPTLGARASAAVDSMERQPSSTRSAPSLQSSQSKPVEPSLHSSVSGISPQPMDFVDEAQPASAHSSALGRSPNATIGEHPASARSIGRPSFSVKTVFNVPRSLPLPFKPAPIATPEKNKDKRLSLDFGTFKDREATGGRQQFSSALQDELDMLQEENESLVEKLRMAQERCEESELRIRQLEKQIASLGEGVSLEARLLSRKEADIQKREAALKVASVNYGGGVDEIVTLRMEAEAAKVEVNSLRTMVQRMVLTKDEMEEVVLKRCWLARCWSLCVKHGIHADIAEARYQYWSTYASTPVEVILAAGEKAKDENSSVSSDLEERENLIEDKDEMSRRANVETMLLVERGLRELNSLKVEEAIAVSMAQKRRLNTVKSYATDELKLPTEGNEYPEAFELSQDEVEDVFCKQALLMYFWRRAKNLDLEADIADDRLQHWINQGNKQPNSHDAVDVERGLLELRKLGLETKLWEESRRMVDPDNVEKTLLEVEYTMLS